MQKGDILQHSGQAAPGEREAPSLRSRVSHRRDLTELIERALRQRVALMCAPAGAGKTAACSQWAATTSQRVIWVTLDAVDDQGWFWALVYSGLERAAVIPADMLRGLQDEPALDFPLMLAGLARSFAEPVVLVIDNVHAITDAAALHGLDLLIRHAPGCLHFLLCGRQQPQLKLARLRALGELAVVGEIGPGARFP